MRKKIAYAFIVAGILTVMLSSYILFTSEDSVPLSEEVLNEMHFKLY